MAIAVIMPKQGQSVESCVIGKWHKQIGEKISVGDALFTYETDKATFDEEAKAEGVLLAVFFEEGDDVECLKTVCVIGAEGENVDEFRPEGASDAVTPGSTAVPAESVGSQSSGDNLAAAQGSGGAYDTAAATGSPDYAAASSYAADASVAPGSMRISPRARTLVGRSGADPGKAVPTGAKGRIMEADIQRAINEGYITTRAAQGSSGDISGTGIGGRITTGDIQTMGTRTGKPSVSPAEGPDFEEVKLTSVRKFIAKAMHASLAGSAQLTLHSSFDATDVMNFRKKVKSLDGLEHLSKITVTDIIIYAVSRVLINHKSINSHFLGDKMVLFNNAHIGVAVDTPRGLLVPTLFRANTLNLKELSDEAKVVFDKCKNGSMEPDGLKGASFTISNLGTFGIEMFTPVLNPPQTGLLGVCSIVERTKDGGKPYPAMGLSLTFDHRALDGADAARFLKELVGYLENFSVYLAVEGN